MPEVRQDDGRHSQPPTPAAAAELAVALPEWDLLPPTEFVRRPGSQGWQ
jgi:hypothetical protein